MRHETGAPSPCNGGVIRRGTELGRSDPDGWGALGGGVRSAGEKPNEPERSGVFNELGLREDVRMAFPRATVACRSGERMLRLSTRKGWRQAASAARLFEPGRKNRNEPERWPIFKELGFSGCADGSSNRRRDRAANGWRGQLSIRSGWAARAAGGTGAFDRCSKTERTQEIALFQRVGFPHGARARRAPGAGCGSGAPGGMLGRRRATSRRAGLMAGGAAPDCEREGEIRCVGPSCWRFA
jgi:hypothetical protein